MKLLIDMNLRPAWVAFFAQAGIEAIHWSSVGKVNAPDTEIMAFARESGHVILTHDLDFGTILAATRGRKPSVVLIRGDNVIPEAIGERVLAALTQMRQELDDGALLSIDLVRARLRILPLI